MIIQKSNEISASAITPHVCIMENKYIIAVSLKTLPYSYMLKI